MKKVFALLAVAGMFLAGCNNEELNNLKAENETLKADKMNLETQLQTASAERDSLKAAVSKINEMAAAAQAAVQAATPVKK
jgi:cell division protein FtsB